MAEKDKKATKKEAKKGVNVEKFYADNIGKKFTVDASGGVKAVVTEDYGYMKKGHTQVFSDIMFQMYSQLGIVKKVD